MENLVTLPQVQLNVYGPNSVVIANAITLRFTSIVLLNEITRM